MTVVYLFALLMVVGFGYAVWHAYVTYQNREARRRRGENGLLEHVATADYRNAARDLLMATALAILGLSIVVPFSEEWRSFLGGASFLGFSEVFVLGMAFARLHELKQP